VVTPIKPSRTFDPNDIMQQHFRTAERMIRHVHQAAGGPPRQSNEALLNKNITQIDYICQPHLVKAFEQKCLEYNTKYGVGNHESVVLGFLGTKGENIDSIISNGFKLSKVEVASSWGTNYGKGIYVLYMFL
jgi:hypothetical protein